MDLKGSVIKIFIYLAVVTITLSCTGANLYKDLAMNKSTDEALFEDAQKLLDNGEYTAAINKIQSTTHEYQAKTRVKESLAGAYAARCGMLFIPFVTRLTGGNGSSFFSLAMQGFVGVDTSNYADCKTAEGIVEGLGALGSRTQSQNLFLLVLEMAKIGNRLRNDADILPTSTGDGTVDAGFNCRTSVPLADAKEIIESLQKFLVNFGAVGSVLSGASIDQINTFVGQVGTNLNTIDYSGGSDPAAADETDFAIILSRGLIYSSSFGIGSCNSADPTQCFCP